MSASEKLKALERRYRTDISDLPDYGAADEHRTVLVAALPQIVAVVEAAEKMHVSYQADMNAWSYVEYDGSTNEVDPDFVAALAALDKALER